MIRWIREMWGKPDWPLGVFKCPYCSYHIKGLENLVREAKASHKCLAGCIIVEDERTECSTDS